MAGYIAGRRPLEDAGAALYLLTVPPDLKSAVPSLRQCTMCYVWQYTNNDLPSAVVKAMRDKYRDERGCAADPI